MSCTARGKRQRGKPHRTAVRFYCLPLTAVPLRCSLRFRDAVRCRAKNVPAVVKRQRGKALKLLRGMAAVRFCPLSRTAVRLRCSLRFQIFPAVQCRGSAALRCRTLLWIISSNFAFPTRFPKRFNGISSAV